jgi:hypothetical protein
MLRALPWGAGDAPPRIRFKGPRLFCILDRRRSGKRAAFNAEAVKEQVHGAIVAGRRGQ